MTSESWRDTYTARYVPDRYRSVTLDDYVTCGDAYPEKVKTSIQCFIDNVFKDRRSLLLYGKQGRAKTMLASATFKALGRCIDDRRNVDDISDAGTASNLFWIYGGAIVNYWKGDSDSEEVYSNRAQREEHLCTAALGCIDDIDKFPLHKNWMDNLLSLIDERIQNCGLPTIITMNTTPEEYAACCGETSASIISRFERNGAYILEVPAVDKKAVMAAQAL